MHLRPMFALLVTLALAGCERTAFQSPPSDSTRCDKSLIGQWVSQPGEGSQEGELLAFVDDACRLYVEQHNGADIKRSTGTALRSDRIAGERYLWIDAAWAHAAFDVTPTPLDADGDLYLFSYATHGRDGLTLHAIRHRALAHRVLDKDVAGELLLRDDALTVRIPGDTAAVAALLRKYRLFDTQGGVHFRREGPSSTRR